MALIRASSFFCSSVLGLRIDPLILTEALVPPALAYSTFALATTLVFSLSTAASLLLVVHMLEKKLVKRLKAPAFSALVSSFY